MQAVRLARLAAVAGTAVVLLAGCGKQANPTAALRGAAVTEAQATQTLLAGFNNVYAAAFQKLDANGAPFVIYDPASTRLDADGLPQEDDDD